MYKCPWCLLCGILQVSLVSSAAEASATAPPGGSVSVVVNEGLQLLLPLAGLFDVEKELKRLDKQKQKVRQTEHEKRWHGCAKNGCIESVDLATAYRVGGHPWVCLIPWGRFMTFAATI